jgi:Fe-S cluster assembly protein SufD
MSERIKISRTSENRKSKRIGFQFTQEMAPVLSEQIQSIRDRAWNVYSQLPFPSTSDEAWRRTDIRLLNKSNLRLLDKSNQKLPNDKLPDYLRESLMDDVKGSQVILSPEGVAYEIDPELSDKGVIFKDFERAASEDTSLLAEIFNQIVRPEDGKFAALASALSNQGIFLYVPKGVHVRQPLHSIIWAPGKNLAHFSHIIIWVEENASVTFILETASPTEVDQQSMHAGVVEIKVARGASLKFVELQSLGEHVWNFTHERAQVADDGQIDWIFSAMGSHLTKNFSDLDLIGSGANGRMSGFYFTDGSQHLDHDTQQNHYAPNTTSDLLFKGALRDNSRSVWQGMIYVAPGAQKTDGYQANRNLMLSSTARADSIPGLEILADDVRCTHGATVSKIDPDQLFYLNSRGIPQKDAEKLIVEGFFDQVMQRIPFEGVRNRLHSAIKEKLG